MRLTVRVVALVLSVAAIALSATGCPRMPKDTSASTITQIEAK